MNKIGILCIIGIVVIVGTVLFIDNVGSENRQRYEEYPVYINGNITKLKFTDEDISIPTDNYSFAIGEDMAIVNMTIYCQNITGDVYGC